MLTVHRHSTSTAPADVIASVSASELPVVVDGRDLVWIDADRPDDAEAHAIAQVCDLQAAIVSEALGSRRPTLRIDGDTVLGAVRTAVTGAQRPGIVRTVVIVTATAIVTCHPDHHRVDAERITAAAARSLARREATPPLALAVLLDELLGAQWTLVDGIDDRLVDAERAAADEPDAAADRIGRLRRDLLTLHRVISPLRRQLADLVDAAEWPGAGVKASFEQLHGGVIALREQVDAQLLLLNGLAQTQVLAASQRANTVMQATSSWGAILVVATLITGIYGMNFRLMPELAWRWGYPFALGLMVATTLLLYRVFRMRGWL